MRNSKVKSRSASEGRSKFSNKIKAEVLEMLEDSSYKVWEIGEAYGISTSTLHKWKARIDKAGITGERLSSESSSIFNKRSSSEQSSRSAEFVEVEVIDQVQKKSIKKVNLVFDDISVCFEGKISSKDLMSVVSILESTC